jgi:hypothetical protein
MLQFLDLWNTRPVYGFLKDSGIACSAVNTGFFDAAKKRGDIKAMFVGHDHSNTFEGELSGITLAYGLKTGVSGYGPAEGLETHEIVLEIRLQHCSKLWQELVVISPN